VLLAVPACGQATREAGPSAGWLVLSVERPAYHGGRRDQALEEACRGWRLDAVQVRSVFEHSERFRERPYAEFYQLGCSIGGTIQADGRIWSFRIDAGGEGVWRAGGEVRYFGCRAPQCDALLLISHDGMTGD